MIIHDNLTYFIKVEKIIKILKLVKKFQFVSLWVEFIED